MQKKKRMKSLLLRGIDRFAQANAVGVAETGGELTHMRSMRVGVAETGGN